jgi:hypothetical protein
MTHPASAPHFAGLPERLTEKDLAGEEGAQEELDRIKRDWGSRHFDPDRGWVRSSLVPCELGQCRRASYSSHVVDGGGVALEPDPLKCERTSGPSHVEDGAGSATALDRVADLPVPANFFPTRALRN